MNIPLQAAISQMTIQKMINYEQTTLEDMFEDFSFGEIREHLELYANPPREEYISDLTFNSSRLLKVLKEKYSIEEYPELWI